MLKCKNGVLRECPCLLFSYPFFKGRSTFQKFLKALMFFSQWWPVVNTALIRISITLQLPTYSGCNQNVCLLFAVQPSFFGGGINLQRDTRRNFKIRDGNKVTFFKDPFWCHSNGWESKSLSFALFQKVQIVISPMPVSNMWRLF